MITTQEPQTAEEVLALAQAARLRRMGWDAKPSVTVNVPPKPEPTKPRRRIATPDIIVPDVVDVVTVETLMASDAFAVVRDSDEDKLVMPIVAQITREIARLSRMHPVEIKADTRRQKPVIARQCCWWLARRYTYISAPVLGRTFGNRDHTTILHGVKSINRILGDREIEFDDLRWREATELLWSIVGNHKKVNPREAVKVS
jgi:hypothetical protein